MSLHRPYPPDTYHGEGGEVSAWVRRGDEPPEITYRTGGTCEYIATGEVDVDFFGGQQPSTGGRTHPIPRLRRAYGELRWSHVSLLVGQEAPPKR